MTLPSSGAISFANVNVELGRASNLLLSLGSSPVRDLAGVPSGAISLANLYGKSAVSFSPAGGSSAASAVALSSYGMTDASLTITCSQNAVWSYSGYGADYVSVSSGGSATSITFALSTSFYSEVAYYSLSATAGGVTRYWTIYLEVFGFA